MWSNSGTRVDLFEEETESDHHDDSEEDFLIDETTPRARTARMGIFNANGGSQSHPFHCDDTKKHLKVSENANANANRGSSVLPTTDGKSSYRRSCIISFPLAADRPKVQRGNAQSSSEEAKAQAVTPAAPQDTIMTVPDSEWLKSLTQKEQDLQRKMPRDAFDAFTREKGRLYRDIKKLHEKAEKFCDAMPKWDTAE